MPQIERSVALAPSMLFTQGAGHRYGIVQGKVPPGKSAPIPGAIKSVDNSAGHLARYGRFRPVRAGADGGRKFQLMGLAENKVLPIKPPSQIPSRFMIGIPLIQQADQKAGVTIDDHSRSSMMIRARSVRTGSPGLGMSSSN